MPKVCFMPWSGEFGWYIMIHVRAVHNYQADYKIVCCEPGEECLYPSANEFYHYVDLTTDHKKRHGGPINPRGEAVIKSNLGAIGHTDLECVRAKYDRHCTKYSDIHVWPVPRINRNIETDILVAPRFRKRDFNRNFKYWNELIQSLVDAGYKVGLIGKEGLSSDIEIDGVIKSWEIDQSVDCVVDMMRSTRMVLATNAGLAHLAILCQDVPLCVISHNYGPVSRVWMREQWAGIAPFFICPGSRVWDNKSKAIAFVLDSMQVLECADNYIYRYHLANEPEQLDF